MPASLLPASASRLRWMWVLVLVPFLFILGQCDIWVFELLTRGWQMVFEALGLQHFANQLQQGVSGQVTTRSLPAMLTYGLLYTGCCLLLLRLALGTGARMRMAVFIYAGVFVACILLIAVGKAAGDWAWSYRLGRRLIDFIISPLPVVILVPLLWGYQPPPKPHVQS
ncbi:hypothetical protein F0P96_11030 [Hymenobacter busanensis]|uniref:Uncharacterized protein n=1 Tax=Hymenobacter busanensis TaxID=2607656 RepID=A0A7L4ZYB2_9BACT|nr:hypothetical protein [Hymenobacter busanensis]KAA9333491.1 hypothetical protein F0P96_11030 [Hymenobacter busanensis]QHJ07825.1 hypothetical protein GUY19_11250 [Hymenobacter busanensis]